jgi:hypothetical protein
MREAAKNNSIVPSSYEPPKLTPVGNLHDVVAGSTQHLICDNQTHQSGQSDGDNPSFGC